MDKALRAILSIMGVLAGLLLLFITISIGYTIFARFFGFSGPVWVVQFTEYSLLWMTLLGAAWVLKKNRHVSVDLLTSRLTSPTKNYLHLAHSVIGITVCGVLCWYGAKVTWGQYLRGVTDIQVVDIPKYLILIIIPLGFLILTLQFLGNFFTNLNKLRTLRNASPAEDAASGHGEL